MLVKTFPYFSSQTSSCGDAWSVQADLPTSPDHPPHGPHDEALLPGCLWNTLTVSYEDQKYDRVVFPHSSKHHNNYDSFSQSSLFSTHLSPPLPLVEVRPPVPFPPAGRDDLHKLRKAISTVRPVLRQSCLLSVLSFVFLLYLLAVVGSVLLLILSIWMK